MALRTVAPRCATTTGTRMMAAPLTQSKILGTNHSSAGELPPAPQLGDAAQSSQNQTAQAAKPLPKLRPRNTLWLYKDINRRKCLRMIAPAGLAPCDQPVTSEGEVRVLGTFCWTREKTVRVPGGEPVFQHLPLPAVLPPAPNMRADGRILPSRPSNKPSRRARNRGANANKPVNNNNDNNNNNNNNNNNIMPIHLLAPLGQAITTMSPSHRLRDTDLIIQRNSLRKLFALCAGRSEENFRVGLHLVHNTLVVTKDDRYAWHPAITRAYGVGLSFEKKFATSDLPGREGDQAHHRVITYKLGDLRCVVQFEVDACYRGEQETAGDVPTTEEPAIESQLSLLSLESAASTPLPTGGGGGGGGIASSASPTAPSGNCEALVAPQSTLAEMKTSNSEKKLFSALPQLWFGRTPWLIQGRREGNTVTAVQVTKVAERFEAWEQRQQEALRRLVTLIRQLRESVRAATGGGGGGGQQQQQHFVLVHDRSARLPGAEGQQRQQQQQRLVHVYRSSLVQQPLPQDMVKRLWGPD